MFHRETGTDLEKCLRILLCQLVEDLATCRIGKGLEDIAHRLRICKSRLACQFRHQRERSDIGERLLVSRIRRNECPEGMRTVYLPAPDVDQLDRLKAALEQVGLDVQHFFTYQLN